MTLDDEMRLASVSKAFSGAAALSLVSSGRLSLCDTVGRWLPQLPRAWWGVTLQELLNHTSGIPNFSTTDAFREALLASLLDPPRPADLLTSVEGLSLRFVPGTRYAYSNSDNIVVGLMLEAVTGRTYGQVLGATVFDPLGLHHTSFPRGAAVPPPTTHGYVVAPPAKPEDVTNLFAAGWTWAAGAVVSTPADTSRFIRAYASGRTISAPVHAAQMRFVPGRSEPPGPGTNAAGLAIFRYSTRCGTVYGHTGNTAGYTQFAASTEDGSRSVVVSINAQITPDTDPSLFRQLRSIYQLGVCSALS
jgi:D-alanyl-D-alanine carboxypeptidase